MSDTVHNSTQDEMPSKKGSEQQFTTLPHPAKTNDPRDLQERKSEAGLTEIPGLAAHHAHGPQILSEDVLSALKKPATREELHRRAEELNK